MQKSYSGSRAAIALTLGVAASAFGQHVERAALPTTVPDVVRRSQDLGLTDPNAVLHVAVSLPYGDQAGIEAYAESVSDPASPNYRHFLTPEEVGSRFGLPEQQFKAVVDHLKASGFNVTLEGKNRLSILADCTVAQAQQAFGTTIHEYQAIDANEPGNTRYFSNNSVPTLPAGIAPYVIDVSGLQSFTKPQHRILTPTQTRTLYNTVPMYSTGKQGTGRTVGISNWDGFRLTNVPLYYSQYGLPTPPGGVGSNITVVTISGGAGGGTANGEADLDIQMVLGMAPLCSLRIYDDGAGLSPVAVLTQEVNDNACDIITESWGWNIGASVATSCHNLHLSMTTQGITYMAASGDSGTTLEPYSYPDYEPEVLSVGGTVPTVNGSGVRTSEVGWSGSGGGWSTNTATFNTLPSWQVGNGVPTGNNHRLVPDVALGASGTSGAYYFYWNGSLSTGSVGTSFACPVFAGALAVSEQQIISQGGLPANGAGKQRFGRIQNVIYAQNGRSDVWFDIVSGTNGSLPSGGGTSSAHAGWDYVTGWGAINFNAFATTQIPPAPGAFSLSSPANGATNQSVTPTLSWGASSNASTYTVVMSTNAALTSPFLTQTGIAGTSFNVPAATLAQGQTYYWGVTAVNGAGNTASTPTSYSFSTVPAPPPPPGAFSLSSPSNGATNQSLTPTLTWSASSGVSTYTLKIATNAALTSPILTQTGLVTTSFNVPAATLAQNQTYYWGVTATNTGGSTASTPASFSFVTVPPPPPGAFDLSSPANGATGVSLTPTLSWTAASGVSTYTVTIANDAALTSVVLTQAGNVSTSFNVPAATLNYGGTYYWGVTAVNGFGSTPSTTSSFSFATIPPPCVGDVNGDGHTNTIDLGIVLAHFGQSVAPNTNGDLNGDGQVNTIDLGLVLNGFGC